MELFDKKEIFIPYSVDSCGTYKRGFRWIYICCVRPFYPCHLVVYQKGFDEQKRIIYDGDKKQ